MSRKQIKKSPEVVPTLPPRYLTVRDAARYLSASVWFIRALVYSQAVPYVRLGRKIVFDVHDLDAYVARQKAGAV